LLTHTQVKMMPNPSDQLKEMKNKIIKIIENVEASEFFEKIPDVIRERTRNGYGVFNGKLKLLPALKESTISRRTSMANNGELSSETTPWLSNLTMRGIMLDSLKFKKVGKKYTIGFDNRRSKNGVSPEQVKNYVEEKGFKFFALADVERDELQKNVGRKIEKEVAKLTK
jgi:hypothetical protein